MMYALRVKFERDPLQGLLLATGEMPLHEHTKRDLFWGDGMDAKTGQDMLGQMLCMIRTIYRQIQTTRKF
jgi:GTP cyclohydrolase II